MIDIDIEEKETAQKIWRNISIQCPICKISQKIEIPENIIIQSNQLSSIFIPKYRICEHKFITVVDKNFIVRGYHKIDFEIDEVDDVNRIKFQKTDIKVQDIDTFMIKINFNPEIISYALYGCIFKNRVYMLLNKEIIHLDKILYDFFNFVFHNSFDIKIDIKPIEKLKEIKGIEEDCVILKTNKNIKNYKKGIPLDVSNFQIDLIKDFYREGDAKKSIILLRDKIREIFSLSQKIVEFYQKQKNKPIKQKILINYLENTHFLKINKDYFNYLIYVVKNYFKVNIILVQDIIANQIEYMWDKSKN